MSLSPQTTVAFSGNRSIIPPRGHSSSDLEGAIRCELAQLLERLYLSGSRTFLSGGAIGFDLIAAQEVLALRSRFGDVELVVVIPFEDQALQYPARHRAIYDSVIAECDRVEVIAERYSVAAYHLRNEFMVRHCGCLVTYNSGEGRGTLSTIKRAQKAGIEVIDLCQKIFKIEQETQLTMDF